MALGLIILASGATLAPARAQLMVYDPTNYVENALQAARQLETLANQARMLTNQARELAASPYSHVEGASQTLTEMAELARTVNGLSGDLAGLQRDFATLYPTAVEGLDPATAQRQGQARNRQASATAQDLARTAAELERLARSRGGRLQGAMGASQAASGQTAAIQSSTQMLAVLSEDLGSMRTLLTAQSRLLAESGARQAADRAAGAEARRRFWAGGARAPANPAFDPFANAWSRER